MKLGNKITVVLVENHALFREAVVRVLSQGSKCCQILGHANTTIGGHRLCLRLKPHLLLLGMAVFQWEGNNFIADLRRKIPQLKILAYSGSWANQHMIVHAIKSGIDGHVWSDVGLAEFLNAMRKTAGGQKYFCPASARLLAEMTRHVDDLTSLSKREVEILRLIASGRTSKEIARSLGLSPATVSTHRRNLMAKISAHNAAEVIRFGQRHELLNPVV